MRPPRLLDQLRELLRSRHYSYRTEQAYVHWIKRFVLFHDKRHPRDMGASEALRLRAQNVDFACGHITVRDETGRKGRVTVLPKTIVAGPRESGVASVACSGDVRRHSSSLRRGPR